ncbi:MAG: transporter [Gemmatales bacterium]|nr:MAG: transporter [Gemmatales bacterium]
MKPDSKHTHDASLPSRLLMALVAGVSRAPWLVLVCALILCSLSVYLALTRLEYHTQRQDLANPNNEYQKRWRRYVAEFGDDDDIVVVVKGSDKKRMKQALETLAKEVAAQPEHFDRLFYKVDLRHLRDRALLYLNSEQISQIQDTLRSMSMLLEPPLVARIDPLIGWKSLTLLQLFHEARIRAGKIVPGKPLSEKDRQFLVQLESIARSAGDFLSDAKSYRNPWLPVAPALTEKRQGSELPLHAPQYFFSEDESLAFLLARPAKNLASFAESKESASAIRRIISRVSANYPDLQIGLTGLPILETDEMLASQEDTKIASVLALAGVALLYLIMFRSWRSPLLTVTTLLVGTVLALGFLTLTVGHLNILSATFAVMLIGMGDYGVLWITHYEEIRKRNGEVGAALKETAGAVGPSILTAAITTALAFYAATLADFRAVAELGWIAGSGVLLCALSCFTVMPAMLTILDGHSTPTDSRRPACGSSPPERVWLPALMNRPGWVIAAGIGLCAVLVVYAFDVYYDHNLLHLQARDLESVQWEQTLIRHTAGASWHALSYTSTREGALELKARYEKLPVVSRVVEVASMIPGDQPDKLERLRDIQSRLRFLPERGKPIPHSLPAVRHLRTEVDCLVGSLQPLADASPRQNDRMVLTELRHSLLTLRDHLDVDSADSLRLYEQRLAGDLVEQLHRLRDVAVPKEITIADLPKPLRERYIGKSGKWLLRIFGKANLWEYEPLVHFVEEIQAVDPEATGKPFTTLAGLRGMKEGFQWAGLYALLAILVVLLADFHHPRLMLAALTPLALGVVMCLGIMGWWGLPLNPANMIAFPLILGVGIDHGVHVLHDYLSWRGQGRPYALSYATGRGIMVAALTTILGFGTLMISRHRGLFGLGFTLTLGIGCCMIAALVFLPAVLRLMSSHEDTVSQMPPAAEAPKQAA